MFRAATAKTRQIRVGIVGAGFAGLRAADVLLRYGCHVTLFEARNRIGGRVAQSNHLGHLVDLGPNWIHGTVDNPMIDIATQTGTLLHDWAETGAAYSTNGTLVPTDEEVKYLELLWGDDGLIPAAFRHSRENGASIDAKKSLYDFFAEKSAHLFSGESTEDADRKRKQFLQLCCMYSFYIGSPVTRQSLRFFWLEECIGGENPFVAETYHKILEAVSLPARQKADIRLNTEVISYISQIPSDNHPSNHDIPSIRTADGKAHSFDEVVVTIPLGCLKQSKSAFHPPLAPRLAQAIDNVSYGQLDKVYITFPSAFWEGPNAEGKASNPATTPESFASFIHFLQPNYAASTNPEQWMQEAVSLAALPADCAHPTLLFYIQGPYSQYVADIVAAASSDAERDAKLVECFEPYFSRLPNYNAADKSCVPKGILATVWASDKFAGYGSYSNMQVGVEAADKDVEVMREGMPERGIWMAGEHTAPFVALGTSTGAYLSGEAVALRIAKAYELQERDVD